MSSRDDSVSKIVARPPKRVEEGAKPSRSTTKVESDPGAEVRKQGDVKK